RGGGAVGHVHAAAVVQMQFVIGAVGTSAGNDETVKQSRRVPDVTADDVVAVVGRVVPAVVVAEQVAAQHRGVNARVALCTAGLGPAEAAVDGHPIGKLKGGGPVEGASPR